MMIKIKKSWAIKMYDTYYSQGPDIAGLFFIIGLMGIIAVMFIFATADAVVIPQNVEFTNIVAIKEYFVLPIPTNDPDFNVSEDLHGVIIDMEGVSYQTDPVSSLWLQSYYATHPFVAGEQFELSGYSNPKVRVPHVTSIRGVDYGTM